MRAPVRLLLAATLASGCVSASSEQQAVAAFFQASRHRDMTALAQIATVSLNPRTEGTVHEFAMVDVSSQGEVTVDAQLRTPDGVITTRRMVLTLQRSGDGGRWRITALRHF